MVSRASRGLPSLASTGRAVGRGVGVGVTSGAPMVRVSPGVMVGEELVRGGVEGAVGTGPSGAAPPAPPRRGRATAPAGGPRHCC